MKSDSISQSLNYAEIHIRVSPQNKSKDFSYFRSWLYTFFTSYGQLLLIWLALPPTPNTYTMLLRIPIALHTSHSIYFLFKKYLFVWVHLVLCGILVPPPWIKPTSSALEGTFFTTGPPGKPPCMCAKLLQICPTFCDPTGCTPPGSSVHELLQARILKWVAMPSSRGSFWPRDPTWVSLFLFLT